MLSNNAKRSCVYLYRRAAASTTFQSQSQRWLCIGRMTTSQLHNSLTSKKLTNEASLQSYRFMSTESTETASKRSLYAAVDHSGEYEEAMNGRHGGQLALAYDEGIGKDDEPYDPFELLEEAEKEFIEEAEMEDDDDDDIEEAEYTEEGDELEVEDDDDDIDEGEVLDAYDRFNTDGSVRRTESEKAALRAGAPGGGLFAIINLAGSQQKVTVDDVVIVNKLKPVDKWSVGSVHTLTSKDVLLMGSSHMTLVGLPGVDGGEVDVMVEEITKDKKVIVFKKRRRKNSRRKNGFRREVTMIRVLDIRFPEKHASHEHRGRDEN